MEKQTLWHKEQTIDYRADGEETQPDEEKTETVEFPGDAEKAAATARMLGELIGGRSLKRRPGVTICGYFISAELIVMFATFVVLTVIASRMEK